MASDYEAAYESVMQYIPAPSSEVDTQEKLARWIKQKDRQNRMSYRFLDRIVETENAKEDLEKYASSTSQQQRATVSQARSERARENNQRAQRESNKLLATKIKKSEGTYTDKKGNRHALTTNKKGQKVAVYETRKGGIIGRDIKTGKFASLR